MKFFHGFNLIIFLSLIVYSCKSDLPPGIQAAVSAVNLSADQMNVADSAIWLLTDEEIENLSTDSLGTLLMNAARATRSYNDAKANLDSLLEMNNSFTDHEGITGIKGHFTIKNKLTKDEGIGRIVKNKEKMEARRMHDYMKDENMIAE